MKSADMIGIFVTIAVVIVAVVFAGFEGIRTDDNTIANEPNNGGSNNQVATTIQGQGATATNNDTLITGKTCTIGGASVNVVVSITGGSAGNMIRGDVMCPVGGGSTLQGSVFVTDPGNGPPATNSGTIAVNGGGTTPRCVSHYTSVANTPSTWTVDCS
jgi:hypothetical protein